MQTPQRTGILAGYLREAELARELGRTERTLARWRKQGTGPPYVTKGREIEYSIDDARHWLAAGGTKAAAMKGRGSRRGRTNQPNVTIT